MSQPPPQPQPEAPSTTAPSRPTITRKTTAAVTISDEERARLAAFRNILSGNPDGGSPPRDARPAAGDAATSPSGGSSGAAGTAAVAPTGASDAPVNFHFSSSDDDDDTATDKPGAGGRGKASSGSPVGAPPSGLRPNAAEWTPDKAAARASSTAGSVPAGPAGPEAGGSAQRSSPQIWGDARPNAAVFALSAMGEAAGASGGAAASGGGVSRTMLGAAGGVRTSPSGGKVPDASGGGGGGDDVARRLGDDVHQPVVQRRAPSTAARAAAPPRAAVLSVQAVPFQPRFGAGAGGAGSGAAGSTAHGRRAPPANSWQPAARPGERSHRNDLSAASAKPLDFLQWAGGAYRGPLQDPAVCLASGVPIWMHLAVLPAPCGQPSPKRVARAWAVQFGLESVEYWTWRSLVAKGVRAPVDCTEPDVLSHAPLSEYLRTVFVWYERLASYRDVKLITDEDRAVAEQVATASRAEFLRYIGAYTASAKMAYALLEEEMRRLEGGNGGAGSLGSNLTSAVVRA
jgi:hypothetical protein